MCFVEQGRTFSVVVAGMRGYPSAQKCFPFREVVSKLRVECGSPQGVAIIGWTVDVSDVAGLPGQQVGYRYKRRLVVQSTQRFLHPATVFRCEAQLAPEKVAVGGQVDRKRLIALGIKGPSQGRANLVEIRSVTVELLLAGCGLPFKGSLREASQEESDMSASQGTAAACGPSAHNAVP